MPLRTRFAESHAMLRFNLSNCTETNHPLSWGSSMQTSISFAHVGSTSEGWQPSSKISSPAAKRRASVPMRFSLMPPQPVSMEVRVVLSIGGCLPTTMYGRGTVG